MTDLHPAIPAASLRNPDVVCISKKKGPVDRTYLAGLHNTKVSLYAHSLAAAKQKAVEHFKPKKKDGNLLWVELAD